MDRIHRLSILIPSIPERFKELEVLYNKIQSQIYNYNCVAIDVEVIIFIDNKKRKIGEKRNDIINLSTGDYICMCDDDDSISDDFIRLVCEAIVYKNPDVITFKQLSIINNMYSIIDFGLKNEIQEFQKNGITKRPVWHCCVIKKDIAIQCRFDSALNWGEDEQFSNQVNGIAKTEYHIEEVLHIYNHQDNKTASFK